jgi:predicted transcriptional regulator
MFEDTLDLAENKLLVLYIFSKLEFPISNIQVTQIVLENNLINYFTLQQYILELVSSDFLNYSEETEKKRLFISEKGNKVLSLFQNRLSTNKKDILDDYLKKQTENIKKEISVTAEYTLGKSNSFVVDLKASENDVILINLKLSVESNKQAKALCARWKENSSELYTKIKNLLTEN